MSADEAIHGGGRFGTDRDGYTAMLRYGRQWSDRVWAIEGCGGIGKHIAHRLLADGEQVVDVPPKPSARARVFASGQGHGESSDGPDDGDAPEDAGQREYVRLRGVPYCAWF